MSGRGSFSPSNVSKSEAILVLIFVSLGIVFGANYFSTQKTVTLQPIIQPEIVKIFTGDNIVIINGTTFIQYEDGNLTFVYGYWGLNIDYKSMNSSNNTVYHFDWIHTLYTSTKDSQPYVPQKIRFEIPGKGKYVSDSITDTTIVFRRIK